MILTGSQIRTASIVHNPSSSGWRDTTYDATVGEIIQEGVPVKEDTFVLAPRALVWIISNEEFHIPNDVTGLATLKTGWTHKGILALNVGIVDPGWHGPLAAAVVNFSKTKFVISKNDPFLRVIFHEHLATNCQSASKTKSEYIEIIKNNSNLFSETFLNINSISQEVSNQISQGPMVANKISMAVLYISISAIIVGLLSAIIPINYSIRQEWASKKFEISQMKLEIENLRNAQIKNERDILESKSSNLIFDKKLASRRTTKP